MHKKIIVWIEESSRLREISSADGTLPFRNHNHTTVANKASAIYENGSSPRVALQPETVPLSEAHPLLSTGSVLSYNSLVASEKITFNHEGLDYSLRVDVSDGFDGSKPFKLVFIPQGFGQDSVDLGLFVPLLKKIPGHQVMVVRVAVPNSNDLDTSGDISKMTYSNKFLDIALRFIVGQNGFAKGSNNLASKLREKGGKFANLKMESSNYQLNAIISSLYTFPFLQLLTGRKSLPYKFEHVEIISPIPDLWEAIKNKIDDLKQLLSFVPSILNIASKNIFKIGFIYLNQFCDALIKYFSSSKESSGINSFSLALDSAHYLAEDLLKRALSQKDLGAVYFNGIAVELGPLSASILSKLAVIKYLIGLFDPATMSPLKTHLVDTQNAIAAATASGISIHVIIPQEDEYVAAKTSSLMGNKVDPKIFSFYKISQVHGANHRFDHTPHLLEAKFSFKRND